MPLKPLTFLPDLYQVNIGQPIFVVHYLLAQLFSSYLVVTWWLVITPACPRISKMICGKSFNQLPFVVHEHNDSVITWWLPGSYLVVTWWLVILPLHVPESRKIFSRYFINQPPFVIHEHNNE